MTIHLPTWPMPRLLREACAEWNLRHQNAFLDWKSSPWPRVVVALLAWFRHRFSNYDAARKAHPELRLALRAQIKLAALRAYPWLGKSEDPRAVISAAETTARRFSTVHERSGPGPRYPRSRSGSQPGSGLELGSEQPARVKSREAIARAYGLHKYDGSEERSHFEQDIGVAILVFCTGTRQVPAAQLTPRVGVQLQKRRQGIS
jgi:hypothetical protein